MPESYARSRWMPTAVVLTAPGMAYVGAYFHVVRTERSVSFMGCGTGGGTHDKPVETWFLTWDDVGNPSERVLYWVFLPACEIDRMTTGRKYEFLDFSG